MIRFQQVAKSFRRNHVLQGIDLQFERGERVALVGSNGAGKTTLIRCLLGEYVCQGKVTVDGLDPRAHREQVLGRVGFVPQLPPPLKMPVGQLVRFAANVCDSEASRMKEMCERLGLDFDRVKRQPFNRLSGGQKQKILISIALGRDSDVLVMDEPAANLDPEARHIFFGLLAERQERAVMLISSHRLDEVAALVNRVVELDRGKVVLDDRVADAVDMAGKLSCRIHLSRREEAFAKTIRDWGFSDAEGGRVWTGVVSGPDRLRFLGVLSRYAGLVDGVEMRDSSARGS
jgi:ABC-2 type transport system ATP-binding protein